MDKIGAAIRIASIKDLDIILPLVQAFHKFEDLHLTNEQRKTSLITLLNNIELGGIWLIYSNCRAVGYIALFTGYSIEFSGKDAFIDEFYIKPEYRGKGLGKQTLEFIKVAAKDLGVHAIHLEVAKSNISAHRLYSQSSFEAREKYVLMSIKL